MPTYEIKRLLPFFGSLALFLFFLPSLHAAPPASRPSSLSTPKPEGHPSPQHTHHSKHTPPIDCPLAKENAAKHGHHKHGHKHHHKHGHKHHHKGFAGIPGFDPKTRRPFKSIAEYMRFLEADGRAKWQQPKRVMQMLNLQGNEKIADIGSGSGYFTFRFALHLPRGKVYAVDVEKEMLAHIAKRAVELKLPQIETRLAPTDDPSLPADADIVFLCNVLHHVEHPKPWLRKAFAQMKKGARLVILEFKPTPLPFGPPDSMKFPSHKLQKMLIEAGFLIHRFDRDTLPYQDIYTLEKPR